MSEHEAGERRFGRRVLTAVAVLSIAATGAAWSGCGDDEEEEAQEIIDEVNEQVEEASEEGQQQFEEGTEEAEELQDQATEEAGQAQEDAPDQADDATGGGSGGGY